MQKVRHGIQKYHQIMDFMRTCTSVACQQCAHPLPDSPHQEQALTPSRRLDCWMSRYALESAIGSLHEGWLSRLSTQAQGKAQRMSTLKQQRPRGRQRTAASSLPAGSLACQARPACRPLWLTQASQRRACQPRTTQRMHTTGWRPTMMRWKPWQPAAPQVRCLPLEWTPLKLASCASAWQSYARSHHQVPVCARGEQRCTLGQDH